MAPLLTLLGLFCAACGAPGSGSASGAQAASKSGSQPVGVPTRVRYVGYANGLKLALVNESHTGRTELYSAKRKLNDAGTKVTTDEVMSAVLEYFEDQSLLKNAAPGAAPESGGSLYTQALEIDVGGRIQHVTVGRNTPIGERQSFQTCAKAFTDLYSEVYALQSVDEVPDFEASATSKKKSAVKEP